MCKDRTTKWGYSKTIKKREYEAIINETITRDSDGKIWIREKQVKQRDVHRYMKRRKVDSSLPRRHLPPAANRVQATETLFSPNRDVVANTVGGEKVCDILMNNSIGPSGHDSSTKDAPERPAAPEQHSAIWDNVEDVHPTDNSNGHSQFFHHPYSPNGLSASLLAHSSWHVIPIERLLNQEQPEPSNPEPVLEAASFVEKSTVEAPASSHQDKLTTTFTIGDSCRKEVSALPRKKDLVVREDGEIASRWIALCSMAAMQQPSGQLITSQYALGEASKLFEKMILTRDPQMLSSLVVFGAVLEARGEDDFVGTVLSHTSAISSDILGKTDSITLTIKWIVNALAKKPQSPRISLSKLREISYNFEAEYGKLHSYYLTSLFNLAKALDLEQYAEEAEEILRDIIRLCPHVYAPGHPQTIISQMNLSRILLRNGQSREAQSIMTSAVSSSQERWGLDHPYTLECLRRQAILLEKVERPEQIENLLETVLRGRIRSFGPHHRYTYGSRLDLESWLENQGRKDEALALEEKVNKWVTEAHNDATKNDLDAY